MLSLSSSTSSELNCLNLTNNTGPLASISNKMLNAKQTASNENHVPSNFYQAYENYSKFPSQFSSFQANSHYNQLQNFQSYFPAQSTQQSSFPFYSSAANHFQNSSMRLPSHRTSTGSTSADSSLSLNSPQSKDENACPIEYGNLNGTDQHRTNSSSINRLNSTPTINENIFGLTENSSIATTHDAKNLRADTFSQKNSSLILNSSISSNAGSTDESMPLKKRRPIPVEQKDSQYWEKRRKNNESAKRSRDIRRSKEEHISIRVIYLEQENLQLRTECALLRKETEKLRSLLYINSQNNNY